MSARALTFRDARREDVPVIVGMLADDHLGQTRERATDPLPQAYWDAFAAIARDSRARLIVVERNGKIVGSMQIQFLPGLSRQGAMRALIEAVRVRGDLRGQGIGEAMMQWAAKLAKESGCKLVLLTSDKSRTRAHAFYGRLGFKQSHLGYKYEFEP
jgi:ribosomal protein S18 acetylase RimI-like enzyme